MTKVKNQYVGNTRNNLFIKNDHPSVEGLDAAKYIIKPLSTKKRSTPNPPRLLKNSPIELVELKL